MKKVILITFASIMAFYVGRASACPQTNKGIHSKTNYQKKVALDVTKTLNGSKQQGLSK